MTGVQAGAIVPVDLDYACTEEKRIDAELYRLASILST